MCISTSEFFMILPHESYRQNNKRLHFKKKKCHGIDSQRLLWVFSSHCCCNAPLLPWWHGRVDCMLWYDLSRNLWMCRSIIAILYLIGHFSLPHLAEVSSPSIGSIKGYRSHMFMLSIFFGMATSSATLNFLFRVRIGGPHSGPVYVSKKGLKASCFHLKLL